MIDEGVDAGAETPEGTEGGEGRRRSRFGSRWARALVAALVLVVVLGGAGAFWLYRQVNPSGGPGDPVEITIPEGTGAATVADILEDEDVISSARIFRVYMRLVGAGEFQAGRYTQGELRERMSMGDAVAALEVGPEITFERLTVPEGLTLDQVASRVGELEGRSAERFLELAESGNVRSAYQPAGVDSLEGLVFPDTYQIAEDEDEEAILRRMVTLFDSVADEVGLDQKARAVGLEPYEAIVLASLVERETKIADERTLVSAVIHNRLEEGMLLQIDATVLYALGEHKDRVLFRDLEVDSPYNTYRNAGLPPGPIASPGRAALEAAVEPADVAFLYYVKVSEDGEHAFAETPQEHQRNIAEAEDRGVR